MAIVARGYGRDTDVLGAIVASGLTILTLIQDVPDGIIVRPVIVSTEARIAIEPGPREAIASDTLRSATIRETIRTLGVTLETRQATTPAAHTLPVVTMICVYTEDGHRIAVEPGPRTVTDD